MNRGSFETTRLKYITFQNNYTTRFDLSLRMSPRSLIFNEAGIDTMVGLVVAEAPSPPPCFWYIYLSINPTTNNYTITMKVVLALIATAATASAFAPATGVAQSRWHARCCCCCRCCYWRQSQLVGTVLLTVEEMSVGITL